MKTTLLLIFALVALNVSAKKFIIQDFFNEPTDINAIRYVVNDINDEKCALIRIYTDIKNLEFNSNLGIAKKEIKSDGEIWIYVSPNEKRLEISAVDFMPVSYNFPLKIESTKVYIMKLTSDDQPIRKVEGKGGLTINTNPEGAIVLIDGLPLSNKNTPLDLPDVLALDYKVILTKDRFFPIDTMITVEAEKNSSYMFNLIPKFSDVVINTIPAGAVVTIDDAEVGRTPLILAGEIQGLTHGEHIINIQHKDCYDLNKVIKIEPGKDTFNFELLQVNGTLSVRTIPDGANVYVDDKFLGITPIFDSKINMGNKIINISKEGFSTINHRMSVIENQQVILIDTLEKLINMTINTVPEGAQLLLNGQYMGITPVRIPLLYGINDFTFMKKDYVKKIVQENITKGKTKYEFEYRLDLDQYEVQVLSNPDSANVYIRGEFKGVTPCKIYLPNEKTKIKFERSKFITSTKKIKPGDTNYTIKGELRKTVKESKTIGFCFEKWNQPNDYKARFDVGNLLILKGGWKNFKENISVDSANFRGIFTGNVELSPTIPVTRYAEICPFAGIGAEVGLNDTLGLFKNISQPFINSFNYSFGSYFYANIINNLQVYIQLAWVNQIGDVTYNENYIDNDAVNNKTWNDFFPGRYGFRTAIGVRIRLGVN
jgi:hypothetical protein